MRRDQAHVLVHVPRYPRSLVRRFSSPLDTTCRVGEPVQRFPTRQPTSKLQTAGRYDDAVYYVPMQLRERTLSNCPFRLKLPWFSC